MRIGAHPALAHRREFLEFGDQLAVLIEQFLRLLRAHPVLENLQLLGILLDIRQRNLVRPPEAFQSVAADLYRRAPSLRRAQHNHRPARPASHSGAAGFLLMQFLISETQCSTVAAIAWCMLSGSDPSTKYGVQP